MTIRRTPYAAALPLLLFPISSLAGVVDIAGVDDYFGNGPDVASPSAALSSALSVYSGTQDFDLVAGDPGAASDRQVVHTFTAMPRRLTGAKLEFRVRAGYNYGVHNDGLFLSFTDDNSESYLDSVVYRRSFGPLPPTPPSYPEADPGLVGFWDRGEEAYVELDLAALPLPSGGTLNLIPALRSHNWLDVCVSDETGVDFFRLAYQIGGVEGPAIALQADEPRLLGNSPNPFRNTTQVQFALQRRANASIRVFDVSGRLVKTVHRGTLAAGEHTVLWDGSDESGRPVYAGVYFYRLETEGFADTRKMIVVR